MRPPSSPARFLATTLLLLSSSAPLLSTAHPVEMISPIQPLHHQARGERQTLDERGFADFLGGGGVGGKGVGNVASALGNLTQDLSAVLTDATALLQSFMEVIRELQNATHENELVNLLGLDVGGAKSDSQKVTSATVGAVGANATCPGMAVLFARGTLEPGNVGLYTGPSFFTALRNYINGTTTLAVQGVPYPASIPGFLVGGSPFGSAVMATLVNRTAAACPNTKIVLSGYSQGAQVVHNAMSLINAPAAAATAAAPAAPTGTTAATTTTAGAAAGAGGLGTSAASSSTLVAVTQSNAIAGRQATPASSSASTASSSIASTAAATATPAAAPAAPAAPATLPSVVSAAQINSQVSSVVLFGDPRNGTAVTGAAAGRVLSLCNAQDDICARGGDAITLAHLTYNRDAAAAAMFVMQRSGMGLASADATSQGMGNVPVVPAGAAQDASGAMQLGSGPGLPGMAAFLRGQGGGIGG